MREQKIDPDERFLFQQRQFFIRYTTQTSLTTQPHSFLYLFKKGWKDLSRKVETVKLGYRY